MGSTMDEDYDAPGKIDPTASTLGAVEAKGKELLALTRQISDDEALIAARKARKLEIEMFELPDLMKDAKITSITIGNIPIEMESLIQASLPKENREKRRAILDWMLKNGHGGIIRREITVPLPMGDDAARMKILDALEGVADIVNVDETVNPQSYLAMCRKLVKGDKPVPLEQLNIFVAQRAKIKDK